MRYYFRTEKKLKSVFNKRNINVQREVGSKSVRKRKIERDKEREEKVRNPGRKREIEKEREEDRDI